MEVFINQNEDMGKGLRSVMLLTTIADKDYMFYEVIDGQFAEALSEIGSDKRVTLGVTLPESSLREVAPGVGTEFKTKTVNDKPFQF